LKRPTKPIPDAPERILLVNPTRYLGNLLLSGGLIQAFAAKCQADGQGLLLILDDSFRELCSSAFPDTAVPAPGPAANRIPIPQAALQVCFYPRQQLNRAGFFAKLRLYIEFLLKIRKFNADLAINIEEDTTTNRLTQLSGARFRVGCSPARHGFGYEHVLPINYADRSAAKRHRWHSYLEVLQAAGLKDTSVGYLNLHINQLSAELIEKLSSCGLHAMEPGQPREAPGNIPRFHTGDGTCRPLIAIHPSATKAYKMWPESAFSNLCILLIKNGFQPVLVGAGKQDAARCAEILAGTGNDHATVINLCNRLSLRELASFFLLCSGIVGNDSGPSHLASAQGLPGVVIFGPSDAGIWGPLGRHSKVLQRQDLCDPGCSRRACLASYRCLQGITPAAVLTALQEQIAEARHAQT